MYSSSQAAIHYLRRQKIKKIVVAVPTSSSSAAEKIKPLADQFISLYIQKEYPYAVASFYQNWYDVSEEEVEDYLKKA